MSLDAIWGKQEDAAEHGGAAASLIFPSMHPVEQGHPGLQVPICSIATQPAPTEQQRTRTGEGMKSKGLTHILYTKKTLFPSPAFCNQPLLCRGAHGQGTSN